MLPIPHPVKTCLALSASGDDDHIPAPAVTAIWLTVGTGGFREILISYSEYVALRMGISVIMRPRSVCVLTAYT